MVARYKKSIYKLTELLRALEANRSNYKLLLRLQRELVVRIKRTDHRIAELRQRKRALNKQKGTGAPSKAASQAVKRRIAAADEAVSNAQWMLFLWRCFGDGIAFIYIDKYATKHMLYNTHDYSMKEAAGPLLHKEGHKREWSIVRGLAKKQMPAILCDITNILRHGDVCLLIGPDPLPIEVKSSANWNARAERQIASLKALRKFLETDEADNFRGRDHVKRMELPVSDANHASAMNECIQRSRDTGFASISPEDGLTYICVRSRDAVDQVHACARPESVVQILNEAKSQGAWAPYYPFTLSIRKAQDLWEFINGEIILAVILETRAVIRSFERNGLHAQFIEHDEWILVATRLASEREEVARIAMGWPFFSRLFYEFEPVGPLADVALAGIGTMESMSKDSQIRPERDARWEDLKPMRWLPPSGDL